MFVLNDLDLVCKQKFSYIRGLFDGTQISSSLFDITSTGGQLGLRRALLKIRTLNEEIPKGTLGVGLEVSKGKQTDDRPSD